MAVRVLPAEFARIVGCSKQSVSRWLRNGTVTLGADGRLDPTHAMRQLIRHGDPGRIRLRLVKQAMANMTDLRAEAARAGELEQQLSEAKKRIAFLDGYCQELDETFDRFLPSVLFAARHRFVEVADDEAALRRLIAESLDLALIQAGDSLGSADFFDVDLSALVLPE
jgi:transcriptional regulator with XRE-family HTH domain